LPGIFAVSFSYNCSSIDVLLVTHCTLLVRLLTLIF
jgi:hypothetical protein